MGKFFLILPQFILKSEGYKALENFIRDFFDFHDILCDFFYFSCDFFCDISAFFCDL